MTKRFKHLTGLSTNYELYIGVGFLMVVTTLSKLLGFVDLSSDWFWFVAGLGLIVQGMILVAKQKMFDKKYKVVLREK